MERQKIWQQIELELRRAKKKFPKWPEHIVARSAIVSEEAGELTRACLQWKYERDEHNEMVKSAQFDAMRDEAIQVAVTAIRFLENLKEEEAC